MTENHLQTLTPYDNVALLEILSEQIYPRSAKELRVLLRKHGLHYPEYLITRALRVLLSDDKVRFKGGRWMSPELHTQLGVQQVGYTPKSISIPDLSPIGKEAMGNIEPVRGEPSENGQVSRTEVREPWVTFRRLLRYYRECVRDEGGADASSFMNEMGKQFVFINGTGNWFPRTGDKWNYILPMGEHIADFQRTLSRGQEDNVVVLGYPIEAFRSSSGEGEYTLIRPIFYYLLDVHFTGGSISLSIADAQPEISPEWMKYALQSYQEQYHFLSACGLLNQPRPSDEMPGFASGDTRPDLDDLARTLSSFLPRRVREPLNPRSVLPHTLPSGLKNGIYNRAVIMAGTRTKYTQTLLRELSLIEQQPDGILENTSLSFLFKQSPGRPSNENSKQRPHEACVADVLPLNAEQREATASLLQDNISVVTGPPGTGKSQVVVATVANARLFGQSVLFTSRNHKAIDAVYDRARDRNDKPVMVRANSKADPNINYSFGDAVSDLLSTSLDVHAADQFTRQLDTLRSMLEERGKVAEKADKIQSLRDRIGEIEQDIAWLNEKLDSTLANDLLDSEQLLSDDQLERLNVLLTWLHEEGDAIKSLSRFRWFLKWHTLIGTWQKLRRQLAALPETFGVPRWPPLNREKLFSIDIGLLQKVIQFVSLTNKLRPLEDGLFEEPTLESLVQELSELNEPIRNLADELLTLHLQITGGLPADSDLREDFAALQHALKALNQGFDTKKERSKVHAELKKHIPLLLENFPCWGVTNLSVGSKIPLSPAMFDLVLIDEASQCDIASAIPILFRSKRAGVVGDPHQLKHVHKLTVGKDSLFQKRAGLTDFQDKRFSYRETSLYDLFAQTNFVTPRMLRETYRSCQGIAEYSNDVFYSGQLRVATDESKLQVPAGLTAGIHWTEIKGDIRSAGRGGCVCDTEVEAAYQAIRGLLVENNYRGSIGVVTPFRMQANRLKDRIFDGDIPYIQLQGAQVDIDTSHGFQGDEKDVMIFSLCGGPDMPDGSRFFLRDSGNLFNVAVSRARAVLHVVGNREWAATSGIHHVEKLARPSEESTTSSHTTPWAPYESPWEQILANKLIEKGLKPNPQYPVAGRRLDLALIDKERGVYLDVEVDGDLYHRNPDGSRKKDDLWRDITIQGRGWKVLRFWVYRLKDDMESCVAQIESAWRQHG